MIFEHNGWFLFENSIFKTMLCFDVFLSTAVYTTRVFELAAFMRIDCIHAAAFIRGIDLGGCNRLFLHSWYHAKRDYGLFLATLRNMCYDYELVMLASSAICIRNQLKQLLNTKYVVRFETRFKIFIH